MTYDEAMALAEEVFDEEYSGLDKDSFLIGFQEAFNALTALYKDKFELVKQMREAQKELETCSIGDYAFVQHCAAQLESEVDEYLEKME